MALIVNEPASIFDMAEMGGASTQMHWAVVKEMWSSGETIAIRDGGRLLAVVGLYPIEGGAEAWFNVRPEAAPFMREVVRFIRLTLVSRRYPEIVVLCTSKAGSRIARLCGFDFVETVEHGEIWHEFAGREQRREACEAAGGATAAQDACGIGAAAG